MADRTPIEWCDASWNPIRARNKPTGKVGWFCTHASDGCRFCYAETFNRRLGTGIDYRAQDRDQVEIFVDEKILGDPLRWRRPRKIFTLSMSDLFGEFIPDEMIDRVFAVMALAPQHTFLVLTKRAQRMRDYMQSITAARLIVASNDLPAPRQALGPWPLPNCWLGVSAEDQTRADERIPLLLDTPAAKRFVSLEPLLGPIDAERYLRRRVVQPHEELTDRLVGQGWSHPGGIGDHPGLDWVIVGGESGAAARPMHPDWARSLRDQCQAADVAFHFKQWGAWLAGENLGWPLAQWQDGNQGHHPSPDHIEWRHFGTPGELGAFAIRVGKKAAGRLLDGVEHSDFPA